MRRLLVGFICVFTVPLHAAQRDHLSVWFVDSLVKVFPDSPAVTSSFELALVTARNGHSSLQVARSEEHTSELQSQSNLVCRLLLEKKKENITITTLLLV